jgi:YD repeat-containing protein
LEYLRSWRRVLFPRRPPGRAARKERRFQAGRLVAVELPGVYNLDTSQIESPRYVYGYDAQGNQTLLRDPLGRETWFTFDAQNRQVTRTLPLGTVADDAPQNLIWSLHLHSDASRTTRTLATGSGAVDATALGSIDLRMLPSASYAPVSS